jgi:Threonine aldolase
MKSFGSDNHSGIHPEILAAIAAANDTHAIAYGDDVITKRLEQKFKNLFGEQASIFPVFNGTGANVLCLQALMQSHNAVICAESAHINVDECAAPERFTGAKLLTVSTNDGKLTPELVRHRLYGLGSVHHAQPKVISISQSTEYGTLYTPYEIKALADLAHSHNMYLHIDGARLSNAAAALQLPFHAFTIDVGVDALSFGGTKNGLMIGEVVVLLRPELTNDFKYKRKQSAQLYSKMRFMSAQLEALFTNDLYLRNASQANAMAKLLAEKLADIPAITITQKVEVNVVFAILPRPLIDELMKKYIFYEWNVEINEVRWMCSFDTTEQDIEEFVDDIKQLL